VPSPPKLNFKYSLCVVDKAYSVINEVQSLPSNIPWTTITIDNALKNGEYLAIRLIAENEQSAEGKATLYKLVQ
jgi:phosphoribosylcarboxyaminoimidazole (NCAIR) mutase